MTITLHQFEQIDGLMSSLLRMGEFETCADPRGYIRTENRLLDACIEATSYAFANDFASGLECAAHIVTGCLLGTIETIDAECVA